MRRFKLITLNIAHGRGLSLYQGFSSSKRIQSNLQRIGRFLKQVDADIVALQEVDEDSHWNKRIHLLDELRKHAEYPHHFLGVHNRRDGMKRLAYGNALLSRFPMHRAENRPFGTATLGEKGFLYAEIDIGRSVIPLVNMHLDFRSKSNRIRQIERVLDYLHDKRASGNDSRFPPIICGDFNSTSMNSRDAAQHLFKHILDYGDYTLYPRGARTFPAHLPFKGVDFVFLPAPFRKIHCEVVRRYLSDHLPVVVEFAIEADEDSSEVVANRL